MGALAGPRPLPHEQPLTRGPLPGVPMQRRLRYLHAHLRALHDPRNRRDGGHGGRQERAGGTAQHSHWRHLGHLLQRRRGVRQHQPAGHVRHLYAELWTVRAAGERRPFPPDARLLPPPPSGNAASSSTPAPWGRGAWRVPTGWTPSPGWRRWRERRKASSARTAASATSRQATAAATAVSRPATGSTTRATGGTAATQRVSSPSAPARPRARATACAAAPRPTAARAKMAGPVGTAPSVRGARTEGDTASPPPRPPLTAGPHRHLPHRCRVVLDPALQRGQRGHRQPAAERVLQHGPLRPRHGSVPLPHRV